jgi:carbamoyltransferase
LALVEANSLRPTLSERLRVSTWILSYWLVMPVLRALFRLALPQFALRPKARRQEKPSTFWVPYASSTRSPCRPAPSAPSATVLGLSAMHHDAAACLVSGRDVLACEEERFSRVKHDASLPLSAIHWCLRESRIDVSDLDAIVFYERSWLSLTRVLASYAQDFPHRAQSFATRFDRFATREASVASTLRRVLGYRGRIIQIDHHLSHAASSFYASGFERAAVLTVDGVGEWATTATGSANGNHIALDRQLRYPHSLGLLYLFVTDYLGFQPNDGEYKVMGLAAYGEPSFKKQLAEFIATAADGTFQLDLHHFPHRHRRLFSELFGPPRLPEQPIEAHHANLASSVQAIVEELVLALARDLHRRTGESTLCMAGGVALNGLANQRVRNESGFTDIFIQPAAGDAGAALGAALYGAYALYGAPRAWMMRHAFLGPSYDSDVGPWLAARGIPATKLDDDKLATRVAGLLAEKNVIGWMRGRMEFGPRALGARSILASPFPVTMRDRVNEKIKWREPFRPFAPAVTVEDVGRFFHLEAASPFMLYVVPVRMEARPLLSAVTHVDGTARVQTVDRETNPVLYKLLRAFEARAGVPALLNTSFNVRGEPIVGDLEDAFACFVRTEIDYLVLGNYLIGSEAKTLWRPC